jgi:beta-galactosidase/beta-glucuronidase
MDEAFDCWEKGKNQDDYHVYFDEWWQRDMASMVKRDTNHPSVVMWSIGNEIPMRDSADGYRLAKELADFVRNLDPTRPVTSAVRLFLLVRRSHSAHMYDRAHNLVFSQVPIPLPYILIFWDPVLECFRSIARISGCRLGRPPHWCVLCYRFPW